MHVNRKYADICYLGVFFPYIPQEQRQMHSHVVSLQDCVVKQRRKETKPCRTKHAYSQYAIYAITYLECTICKSIPNMQYIHKHTVTNICKICNKYTKYATYAKNIQHLQYMQKYTKYAKYAKYQNMQLIDQICKIIPWSHWQ